MLVFYSYLLIVSSGSNLKLEQDSEIIRDKITFDLNLNLKKIAVTGYIKVYKSSISVYIYRIIG